MCSNSVNIAFIPIDNRPVCYTLAEQIAKIDGNVNLMLPDRALLGGLTSCANVDAILNWLESINKVDKIIVALDTIAYGGLVSSRRSSDTLQVIQDRVCRLKDIVSKKNAEVYAFSSIMRISNNNVNEEEKDYWSLYGEKIFKYSFDAHKHACQKNLENNNQEVKNTQTEGFYKGIGSSWLQSVNWDYDDGLNIFNTDIPVSIIEDYLNTRQRNFEVNKTYLNWAGENFFNTLVFSKDDCAQYGFNVKEAQVLEHIIKNNNLNALIKTGADEIPLSLLGRAIVGDNKRLKIFPLFVEPNHINKISKYEDVSVYESVKGQIELVGAEVSSQDDCDLVLLVNNFQDEQGELVMGVDVDGYSYELNLPESPYLIADIRNANGADNKFVDSLFKTNFFNDNFFGYAAWNTTGNTLGSVLCCAIFKFFAKQYNEAAFKSVQMIRFLDDWAYQANVRKILKSYLSEINIEELKNNMITFENVLSDKLNLKFLNMEYLYPWNRFFEIEVVLGSLIKMD